MGLFGDGSIAMLSTWPPRGTKVRYSEHPNIPFLVTKEGRIQSCDRNITVIDVRLSQIERWSDFRKVCRKVLDIAGHVAQSFVAIRFSR